MPSVSTNLAENFADAEFLLGALRRCRRPELVARIRREGGVAPLREAAAGDLRDPLHGAERAFPFRDGLVSLAARKDVHVVFLGGADYPRLLDQTADPPALLFVRTEAAAPLLPGAPLAVALVGSRRATPYGRQVAERFGRELAGSGVSVVSGMALGIDSHAHRGALAAKGPTVAVLGCGIDVDYPKENRSLAAEISASGGSVVTEYAPGTFPMPENFPERNRIVAGLSDAVCVVEARERSGSLITARLGLEENREVFGVPGSVLGDGSAGVHALLRQGARLVASAADLLVDLRPDQLRSLVPEQLPLLAGSAVPDWLRNALSLEDPQGPDELAARTGRAIPELLVALLDAELAGAVRTMPGGRYLLRA